MPTILVPLNETAFSEAILPDAAELAGPGGKLVLVYVAGRGEHADEAERYLSNEAQMLDRRGFQTATDVLKGGNVPQAIDKGVTELGAEMVAVATHGTEHWPARSSVAWKTLVHSPVPILLHHFEGGQARELDEPARQKSIMVPLDGSPRAEQALPVAASLAAQWQAPLLLVRIGDDPTGDQAYLDRIAGTLKVPANTALGTGMPADALAQIATDRGITHVVMTSHGRTGLSRMITGDVAAELIDRLSLPVVVVPSLVEPSKSAAETSAPATVGSPAST